MTAKQYLRMHPEQYVMVTYQYGYALYIAPLKGGLLQITDKKDDAEIWSFIDNTPTKLNYHISETGYKELKFEKI
jgi:hypothetical protein